MKNWFLLLFLAGTNTLWGGDQDAIVFISSGLDSNDQPVDKLAMTQFQNDNFGYVMYLYSTDRKSPLGTDKVNFNLSRYNDSLRQYVPDAVISMDIQPSWSYCYHPLYFYYPGEYKIVVIANNLDTIANTLYFDIYK